MKDYPLFSFVIVSYKNFKYIYECIDSVLMQDYPNIELIISNDGSDDFDDIKLKDYINEHKDENIKRVVTNNNPTNVGTIKNINKALSFVSGEYVMMLAADDALFDKSVFSDFVNYFKENPEMSVVTSQCGMYEVDLETFQYNAVRPEQIEMIKNYSPEQLYNELSVACLIPAGGCCYKTEIYKKYGYYDEAFFLIEDWSFFLRIVRMGERVGWLDITAMKHRDGGISHGNSNNDNKAMFHYYDDVIKITEKEILPYISLLSKDKRKQVKKDYNNLCVGYIKKYKWNEYSINQKLIYCVTHFGEIVNKLSQMIKDMSGNNKIDILSKLSAKKRILFMFSVVMLLIYQVCEFKGLMPVEYSEKFRLIIGYIGLGSFIGSFLIVILEIFKKIWNKILKISNAFIRIGKKFIK